MITLETRLMHTPDILTSEVDGELVMMDVGSGTYFNLDPIGTDIWRRLESPASIGELCAALQHDYDSDVATIQHDVQAFAGEMLKKGLLRLAG